MAKKNTSVIQVMITGDASDLRNATSMGSTALYAMAQAASFAASVVSGIAAASIKAASDFESAFAGVEKTVKATDAELAQLSDGIREMSTRMPASAVEIAGVAEAAGQLGIQTDAILGFTEVMVMLGDTTNIAAKDAATVLARLASITQMPQDEFDRLGASVVALGNSLPTTEAEIIEMSLGFAGMASVLGLSEAQILAFSGAVSSVGVEAEAGGSSLTRIFSTINTAVSESGGQLETFARIAGMSSADFGKAFRTDAAGAVEALITGFQGIRDAGGDVTEVLKEVELDEIRVQRTMLGLIGSGDRLSGALDTASASWRENTALSEEAAKRYETFASQLSILKNNFTDVAIEIGTVLLPYLIQFIDWFKDAMPAIRDFVDKALPKIDEFATSISTFIREKAIPAIENFFDGVDESKLIGGLRETFMSAIETAIPVAADLVEVARKLIADLGVAIKDSDPKAFGEALGNFLADAFREGVELTVIMKNWVDTQVANRGGWYEIGKRLAVVGSQILLGFVIGVFSGENMMALINVIADNFWDIFWTAIGIALMPAKVVGFLTQALSKIPLAGPIAAWAIRALDGAGGKVIEGIKAFFRGIVSGFRQNAFNIRFAVLENLGTPLMQGIDDVALAAGGWVTRFANYVGMRIGTALAGLRTRFATWFDDVWDLFKATAPRWLSVGADIVEGIIKGIWNKASSLYTALKNLASSALAAARERLKSSSPSMEFFAIGQDMMAGMALGVKQAAGMVDKQLYKVIDPMLSMQLNAPDVPVGAAPRQSTINLTVQGAIDPEGTARTIIRVLEDAQRRSGVRLAL